MLKVIRIAEGSSDAPKKEVVAVAETQEEAIEAISEALKHFSKSGRNEEHHYWWGRNEGETSFRYFIEGAQPATTRGG